jgi:hypothetical protein
MVDQNATLVGALALNQDKGVNGGNTVACKETINFLWGKALKQVASADDRGDRAASARDKCFPKGGMSSKCLCPLKGRVLVDQPAIIAMHVNTSGSPALVFVDLDASRAKSSTNIPSISQPLHAGGGVSSHCCIIDISLDSEHARNAIKICQYWIHRHAEKEDTKRSPHVNAGDDHSGW